MRSRAALIALTAATTTLNAQTFTFTRLADTSTPIPGAEGTFEGFDPPFVINAFGDAGFRARGPGHFEGIYGITPTLTPIIDTDDTPPQSDDDFISVIPGNAPTIFTGTTSLNYNANENTVVAARGIYFKFRNTYTTIAEVRQTIAPGSNATFSDVGRPTINQDRTRICFEGLNPETGFGIYTYDLTTQSLSRIADSTFILPRLPGTFNVLGGSMIDNDTVVFHAVDDSGQRGGIYLAPPAGGLTVVADSITPHPTNGLFLSGFNAPFIRDGVVTFEAFNRPDPRGLLQFNNGTLSTLTDADTPVPGGTGPFFHYGQPTTAGESSLTIFRGFTPDEVPGIYVDNAGTITPIITAAETLDGTQLTDIVLGRFNFDGQRIVFLARFEDDTEAIYQATLDPPSRGTCPCDLDQNNILSADDLLAFLDTWFNERHVDELLDFLDCWLKGC